MNLFICLSEKKTCMPRKSRLFFGAEKHAGVKKKSHGCPMGRDVSQLPNRRGCLTAPQCDKTLTCTALCLQLKLTKLATLGETLSPWSYCLYLAPSVPAPVQCKIRNDIERIFRETHLSYPRAITEYLH